MLDCKVAPAASRYLSSILILKASYLPWPFLISSSINSGNNYNKQRLQGTTKTKVLITEVGSLDLYNLYKLPVGQGY